MALQCLPSPALRPFVAQLWASDGAGDVPYRTPWCEHALPSGAMHLVIRLSDRALRIADAGTGEPAQSVAHSLVGGMRSRFYRRELLAPSSSVGAVLRPGAAECLFGGVTADELAERHTPLDGLWGGEAHRLRERLLALRSPRERLAVFEAALAARLPRAQGLHPAVAGALAQFRGGVSVAVAARDSGFSHRRFLQLFRQSVGLAPKTYLRVLRFQRVLPALQGDAVPSLAALAADMGYSDQSHFNREFMAFSGVTPLTYRQRMGAETHHLHHLPMGGG
jgi:AraC-like DNA-binding protein